MLSNGKWRHNGTIVLGLPHKLHRLCHLGTIRKPRFISAESRAGSPGPRSAVACSRGASRARGPRSAPSPAGCGPAARGAAHKRDRPRQAAPPPRRLTRATNTAKTPRGESTRLPLPRRPPSKSAENPEAGGYSLAALEAQPYREHMPNHSGDRRGHHPAAIAARPAFSDPDRRVAFGRVQEERQHTRDGAGIARDVRGADIAAADRANISAAKRLHDQKAEGNRSEKIGEGGNPPVRVHAAPFTNAKLLSFAYSAPDFWRMLSKR